MNITVQFTNKQILIAVSMCFSELSPRFQVQLLDLYKLDNNFETVQSLTIPFLDLRIIYKYMSRMPEGVVGKTNKELKDIILPLILEKANLGEEDALELLKDLQAIDIENENEKGRMINYMHTVFTSYN